MLIPAVIFRRYNIPNDVFEERLKPTLPEILAFRRKQESDQESSRCEVHRRILHHSFSDRHSCFFITSDIQNDYPNHMFFEWLTELKCAKKVGISKYVSL